MQYPVLSYNHFFLNRRLNLKLGLVVLIFSFLFTFKWSQIMLSSQPAKSLKRNTGGVRFCWISIQYAMQYTQKYTPPYRFSTILPAGFPLVLNYAFVALRSECLISFATHCSKRPCSNRFKPRILCKWSFIAQQHPGFAISYHLSVWSANGFVFGQFSCDIITHLAVKELIKISFLIF